MSGSEIVRRSSYGPSSPRVGERGGRTRQQIIDATLRLFGEQGFHGTLIEDIARAAGVSQATLYQYFASKEDVFVELAEAGGAALIDAVERLGRLGPDREGFQALRNWLHDWSAVYSQYATVFIQWAQIRARRSSPRPKFSALVERHTALLSGRLIQAGTTEVSPAALALGAFSAFERCNYYQRTGISPYPLGQVLDTAAVVLQLMLFPATPHDVFPAAHARRARRTREPLRAGGEGHLAPEPVARPYGTRFDHLSARGRRRAKQILDAGGQAFADHGYHRTSVDDIVSSAGVARGTFYKYFDDKLDLLTALSRECAHRVAQMGETMSQAFAQLSIDDGHPAQLDLWVTEFVALHRQYVGVFRMWTEDVPSHPQLSEEGKAMLASAMTAFSAGLARVHRPYALDAMTAAFVLMGILEGFPDQAVGTRYEMTTAETIDTMVAIIRRGFLNA